MISNPDFITSIHLYDSRLTALIVSPTVTMAVNVIDRVSVMNYFSFNQPIWETQKMTDEKT
ncbi:hypothetical protein DPMN_065187 [Dreissena polymorpha]|uniref:Uncharacterized protein n=1 Tax=Dreissena polymorpha TaxID=45954 RepID=A0A9D4CDL7_DREPO|nr:hypothetical protein DPMN_065187 [Dreissena polymorpha]